MSSQSSIALQDMRR